MNARRFSVYASKYIARYILSLFAIFAVCFFTAPKVFATVSASDASTVVSADTNSVNGSGAWTTVTTWSMQENANGDTPTSGTLIFNAPSGFAFNTGAAVTATITKTGGNGSCFTFSSNSATPTATTITFTFTGKSSNGTRCSLTIANMLIRPTNAGTTLSSGNITRTGTAVIAGFATGAVVGTMTETAGAKSQLVITQQPPSSTARYSSFTTLPIVAVEDQFGNIVTSDNSTTISRAAVLSNQSCGGTSGSGTINSVPADSTAVTSGVMTYTTFAYDFLESIKICFTSSGISSALSSAVSLNATSTISLNTANAVTVNTGTPTLQFTGTDPESDNISYNVNIDPASTFDSTPATFNISRLSYTNKSFTMSGETHGIYFANSGRYMYSYNSNLGDQAIDRYTLSTPYDISTAVLTDFGNCGQCIYRPQDIAMNPAGTVMFVLEGGSGTGTRTVYQYTLSTPYDVSTLTYANKSFLISQDTLPINIFVDSTGTKMYIMGNSNGTIYQYSLSSSFDISTASYASKSLNLIVLHPAGFTLNSTGTKLIFADSNLSVLHQYSLNSAYDISTAVDTGKTADISATSGVVVDDTETKLYASGITAYQYVFTGFSNIDATSGVASGFANAITPANTSPFNSGEKISYTVQGGSTLSNGTYYWRVRALDSGSGTYSDWSSTQSFTVSLSGGGGGSGVAPTRKIRLNGKKINITGKKFILR